MRSSVHFAGWILAVAVAALGGGCARRRVPEARAGAPELRLEGVQFRLFRGETLRAEGTASTLTYQRESTAVTASEIGLRLHGRQDPVKLTAPAGAGVLSERTFQASGGLLAVRGTDSARTDSARYDPALGKQGEVVGDDPVELSGEGYRMRGDGFVLDPADAVIVLRGSTRLVAGLGGVR